MEEMIRILIVDDERIVRKGIVTLIPWEKYGMQVIGEAGSAEEAIAFLMEHKVDLLCTDLEMPGMSGTELIRRVRIMEPSIQIAVFTMHQDFTYIQEVLRLGVMDYLTKAQLEKESIDAIIGGLAKRYRENAKKTELYEQSCEEDEVCAFCLWSAEAGKRMEAVLSMAEIAFYAVKDGWYVLKTAWKQDMALLFENKEIEGVFLKFLDCRKITYAVIGEAVELYGKRLLFLEYQPEKIVYEVSLRDILKGKSDEKWSKTQENNRSGGVKNEILESGMKMDFITDERLCQSFLEELKEEISRPEEMPAILYPFNLHWNQYTDYDLQGYFDEVGGFRFWYEWEIWIRRLRNCVQEHLGGHLEDLVNTDLIYQAVNYIKSNMKNEITLDELLKLTGMGKSHFSKHFKRVTGETFVTYLNDLRIQAAKKYLEETDLPIYQIAYQVGYVNERYFRKSFQSRTGEQPRKYRNRMKDSAENNKGNNSV